MFYAITNQDGHLLIIDGGNPGITDYFQTVLSMLGNKIDFWFLTHPHIDHIGVFCSLWNTDTNITADKIYTVDMASVELCQQNASWDDYSIYQQFLEYDIANLEYVHAGDILDFFGNKITFFSAYDEYVDELSSDLVNDGSMMFKIYGETESMLFCSDIGKSLSDYLENKYSDEIPSDYIQMGHHGNGGLLESFYLRVNTKIAFFDAPEWLMNPEEGSIYTTPENRAIMESLGSEIYYYADAPTVISIN